MRQDKVMIRLYEGPTLLGRTVDHSVILPPQIGNNKNTYAFSDRPDQALGTYTDQAGNLKMPLQQPGDNTGDDWGYETLCWVIAAHLLGGGPPYRAPIKEMIGRCPPERVKHVNHWER